MTSTASNPVWDVYDLLRTVNLNVKYYSARLERLTRLNFFIELILAIAVPTSAVGLWWVWDTSVGKPIWQSILGVSALVAVAKPLLKLTDTIRKYEVTLKGYRELDHRLRKIRIQINQDRAYNEKHRKMFEEVFDREGELDKESPETRQNMKLTDKLSQEVDDELPVDSFYIPS